MALYKYPTKNDSAINDETDNKDIIETEEKVSVTEEETLGGNGVVLDAEAVEKAAGELMQENKTFTMQEVVKIARSTKVPLGTIKKNIAYLSKKADKAAAESNDPNFDKKKYMQELLAGMRK